MSSSQTDGKKLSNVQILIAVIQRLIIEKSPVVEIIEHPQLLLRTLEDLDDLIEMFEVKHAIVDQIQSLLLLAHRQGPKAKFPGHKLHTVFYGAPGVGKSKTAIYMAKIWYALGVATRLKREIKQVEWTPPTEDKSSYRIASEASLISSVADKIRDLSSKIHVSSLDSPPSGIRELMMTPPGFLGSPSESPRSLSIPSDWSRLGTLCEDLKVLSDRLVDLCQPTIIEPPSEEAESATPRKNPDLTVDIPVVVCGREELVAGYEGQSGPKAQKYLYENRGKIIIIEEAYTLCRGLDDAFGLESLTVLNRFMDEHADEIVIIFTGYKDLMNKGIFASQPGLKRRCQLVFDVKGYTPKGMASIFRIQLKKNECKLDSEIKIVSFFKRNMDQFQAFGGDIERLVYQCTIAYSSSKFSGIFEPPQSGGTSPIMYINQPILDSAFVAYKRNKIVDSNVYDNLVPSGLYV